MNEEQEPVNWERQMRLVSGQLTVIKNFHFTSRSVVTLSRTSGSTVRYISSCTFTNTVRIILSTALYLY